MIQRLLQRQFQVIAFITGWEQKKFQFPFIYYPKTAQKVQMSICMPNAWNIQTFKIGLLWIDKFWWNFAWQSILNFPSWRVTTSLIILKSKLIDDGQLENCEKIFNFLLFFTQKQRESANNHFHAKPVKYSNFYDICTDVSPILMKFCMMTHISYAEHNSCSKSQI